MNLIKPISTIMTRNLISVSPEDSLEFVKRVFLEENIHHLPVVRVRKIIGIISQSDFIKYYDEFVKKGSKASTISNALNESKVKDIMTTGMAKLESKDPIRAAVELFKINRFHAIPVVDNDELVGILTTQDIIKAVSEEPVKLEDYQTAKELT